MPGAVNQFYAGRTLFLTGGSGFLGKQMIEKLLRSCPAIDQIYVLIRTKKGKSPEERINQLFQSPIFDRLKVEHPNFRRKISVIPGDLKLPDLGISDKDRTRIEEFSSIFIHNAADIRFGAPLRESVEQNLKPSLKVLQLAKACKEIKAYVHVSTAFSNSNLTTEIIKEKVYENSMKPFELIKLIESHSDEEIARMMPRLLDGKPNSYSLTKAMGESLVAQERGNLPVVIFRPSGISAALREPFPGWTDGFASPNGFLLGVYIVLSFILTYITKTKNTGLIDFSIVGPFNDAYHISLGHIRRIYGNAQARLDLIPVDLTCNALLYSARYVAMRKNNDSLLVVNFTSSATNPITNGEIGWKICCC